MIDFTKSTLDELLVLQACLSDGINQYVDLDINIFDELLNQVTAELEKRK